MSEREELLARLRREGILHRSPTQPVLSRDGTSGRWMLDSLSVTLDRRGAELAARCLLRELQRFEGRQLATYGLTGVPLLEACILQGKGRYRGLVVRKERKRHGSLKLIEGQLDRSEPVVMLDDSVSSGQSMEACAAALESEGCHVEGGVCLVRFDYERGISRMVERGYRMAAVFDIRLDFMAFMDGEAPVLVNPTKPGDELAPSPHRAPDGLAPPALARAVLAEYVSTGRALGAPQALDRSYDSAGGCWVSLRRRSNIHDRPARSGFWHFPGEGSPGVADDVVQAAALTARQLVAASQDPARTLDECAVAVTFFSALDECTVGELDNDRFGIVVRSRERPWAMGGALPRMPGIGNEWQQFSHARLANAGLAPLEPYRLYRHGVEKVVESGEAWQPTGVPARSSRSWHQRASVAGALAERARAEVLEALGDPAGEAPRPMRTALTNVDLVFVTIYSHGRFAGCMGGPAADLPTALREYSRAAVADGRFPPITDRDRLAVSVSLLFNRHEIGVADPEWVVRPTRFADQVLEVDQGDRRGLLLPFLPVMHNLTPIEYVREVIDKAGITRPPYHWTRYDCTTWLADGAEVRRLRNGLPEGAPAPTAAEQVARLWPLLVGYARRHHARRGEPLGRYEVFADRLRTGLAPARLAYGAWVKAKVGLAQEAADDVRRLDRRMRKDGWICFEGDAPSISELAFLLLAKIELDDDRQAQAAVASTLWGQIDGHGRFATHRDQPAADPAFQDYSPGQALLALARAAERGHAVDEDALKRALRFYRMRFEHNHHWGAVAWLAQAFTAWSRVRSDPALNSFAYAVMDWALTFQSAKTGAFLNDHQSDSPGATTALYLEGLAAVREAAAADGLRARERRYGNACAAALRFVDQLVYQERDAVVLPNPAWAIGGLRTSVTASDVRIDYVFHALAGLWSFRAVMEGET